MREKRAALVITFSATSDAMAMEKYCAEHRLPGRLIPIPREISAGCGLAWKTRPGAEARFARVLEEAGVRWEAMRTVEMWV